MHVTCHFIWSWEICLTAGPLRWLQCKLCLLRLCERVGLPSYGIIFWSKSFWLIIDWLTLTLLVPISFKNNIIKILKSINHLIQENNFDHNIMPYQLHMSTLWVMMMSIDFTWEECISEIDCYDHFQLSIFQGKYSSPNTFFPSMSIFGTPMKVLQGIYNRNIDLCVKESSWH